VLKENEWNTINSILLKIYTIRDIDELAGKIMKMIRMLIPYSKGYFMLFNDEEIDRERSSFIEMDEKNGKRYLDYFYSVDYIQYIFDFMAETITYRDTDILEDDIRKQTEFYKDYLRPQNIPYGSGIILFKRRKILGIINFFRSKELGDFSDKDIYILDILKLHLANVVYGLGKVQEIEKMERIEECLSRYHLSKREIEVVRLLILGLSNMEISKQMLISESTVKKHIYHIYSKAGVKSRTQLMALLQGQTVF